MIWYLQHTYLLLPSNSVGLKGLSQKWRTCQLNAGLYTDPRKSLTCSRKADGGQPPGSAAAPGDSPSPAHCQSHLTADLSGMSSTSCFLPQSHSYCVTHHPEVESSASLQLSLEHRLRKMFPVLRVTLLDNQLFPLYCYYQRDTGAPGRRMSNVRDEVWRLATADGTSAGQHGTSPER